MYFSLNNYTIYTSFSQYYLKHKNSEITSYNESQASYHRKSIYLESSKHTRFLLSYRRFIFVLDDKSLCNCLFSLSYWSYEPTHPCSASVHALDKHHVDVWYSLIKTINTRREEKKKTSTWLKSLVAFLLCYLTSPLEFSLQTKSTIREFFIW